MIKIIAVLGAGTMGHGIAETFALAGYEVNLFDVSKELCGIVKNLMRKECEFMAENDLIKFEEIDSAMDRITVYNDMRLAVESADYVIEATPENLQLKQNLLADLDKYCKPECIFASNTSSLALEAMVEKLSEARKAKTMVCHWYNPAHLMPLTELSFFGNMSERDFKRVEEIYNKAGKQTVKVLKDVPGLVANRIQQGIAREVFSIMEQGIAAPEDVEKALKFGPAFRYATTGQLVVADMGGIDIWATVGDNLLSVMDNSKEASPLLKEKVKQGKLGVKTGEGFFKYPPEKIEEFKNNFNKKLIMQLKVSKNYVD